MTGCELAKLCREQAGSAYIWGGLGHRITKEHIERLALMYPKVFTAGYKEKCRQNIGKLGYDCVGLVKHFLWGNRGDGILRHYDAATDMGANAMFFSCVEAGNISGLPEMPGLLLHRDGHVGIYLGEGLLCEARGIDFGVVISEISLRDFKSWGKLPGVDYEQRASSELSWQELSAMLKRRGIGLIRI